MILLHRGVHAIHRRWWDGVSVLARKHLQRIHFLIAEPIHSGCRYKLAQAIIVIERRDDATVNLLSNRIQPRGVDQEFGAIWDDMALLLQLLRLDLLLLLEKDTSDKGDALHPTSNA
jgi:hypothetical protein